ncbi:NUAK family SNF1-like kinase 1 [Lineus longissimus]|uniref:NUAK family SNF1-like kinase 1 n=1 Tax=Lineus longissimus TaxID=88925 RepID=UPI00315CFBE2
MVHRNNSFPASSSEETSSATSCTKNSSRKSKKMPHSTTTKSKAKRTVSSPLEEPVVKHHHHKHNLKHRFEIVKTLGEGTYGKVKLAVDRTNGEMVAIKYIRKHKIQTEQDLVRIQREIKVMASLRHPHIINIMEVFENKEKIILVMEYAAGGELYDYINEKKVLHETEARKFFRQIVSAIHHCHQNGVVHRDLKLENIVLDKDYNIKIADFGLSNMYTYDSLLSTYCGSPLYASPEIVNGTPYHGPEVDCWSLGVLLYTLVYGAMPFDGSDFKRLRRQITEGDFYEPSRPSDASSLIKHLLQVNPKKRATIADISCHWWVNVGYNYSPMEEGLKHPAALQAPMVYSSFHSHSSDSDENDAQPPRRQIRRRSSLSERSKSGDKTKVTSVSLTDGAVEVCESANGATSPVAFDSNRKPKRGILKNHQSNKSSQKGCVTEENISEKTKKFDLTDLEAALDSTTRPKSDCDQLKCNSSVNSDICDKPAQGSAEIKSAEHSLDSNCTTLNVIGETTDVDTSKPAVVRRRGILKKHVAGRHSGEFEPTNRYSYGSMSSNSSGDVLDFSYDSSDAEHLFTYSFSADIDDIESSKVKSVQAEFDLKNQNVQDTFTSTSNGVSDNFVVAVLDSDTAASQIGEGETVIRLDDAMNVYREALSICNQ